MNKPDYPKHFCLKMSFLLNRGCKLPHLPKACVASWDLKVIVSVFTFARLFVMKYYSDFCRHLNDKEAVDVQIILRRKKR